MGWIAFWALVTFINLASLINHILKDTFPWYSLGGFTIALVCLTLRIKEYFDEG